MAGLIAFAVTIAIAGGGAAAARPQSGATPSNLQTAVGQLGSFDHPVRMEAAKTLRRAAPEAAVPLLAAAARSHADEYVRYRALTLLSGFGGATVAEVMAELAADRNDRLRMVAYAWFEHHPEPRVLPSLIEAFGREQSEFVRPALTRALAAQSQDPRARDVLAPLVLRGADFFRGAVIEALGEYGGRFALKDIEAVAELDGPLQDDAITAIGRLGDASHVPVLARLQRSAPEHLQPTIAAALCLLGRACAEAERYLKDTLAFAARTEGYQALLRSAVHGQGMLALRSRPGALGVLFDLGVKANAESLRAPVALGLGLVALKQPELILSALEPRADVDDAIDLLLEAFDMLAEDFEEERFFVAVRKAYWSAPENSARRRVAEALIVKLEF